LFEYDHVHCKSDAGLDNYIAMLTIFLNKLFNGKCIVQDVIKFGQSTRDYVLLYEELASHK